MASGPITSWLIDGVKAETVMFYFLGLQNHWGWWLQPWNEKTLAPSKKRYDKPRKHTENQRHHSTDKGYTVKAMVSPVVIYGCECSSIKIECWRTDAFKLWCWTRVLRVPWMAKRSNQSILKEINPEYSLEGLTLKLKLQYFGHLMQKADSLEKTLIWEILKAKGKEGRRRMR